VDLRVSTLPCIFGEKIVMRILDKGNLNLDLADFGMEEKAIEDVYKAIAAPYGMVLVTGPTGSGKTTTLYSCAFQASTSRDQHHDRRGPGGVQPRRHQPGAGAGRWA
jgi:type IV pilus assembly protein PilB